MRNKYPIDLTDLVFNNLKCIKKIGIINSNAHWLCECLLCGSETTVSRPNILSGNTKDCGLHKSKKLSKTNTKHGKTGTSIHKRWMAMIARCKDPNKPTYINKGITVCEEWFDFEKFYEWAIRSGFDEKLELDRIDNNEGYSPKNCRWVTHAENCRNRGKTSRQYAVKNSKGEVFETTKKAEDAYNVTSGKIGQSIKNNYKCAGLKWERISH